MTFIEGVGDEVTAFFVVAVVLILATLITFIGGGASYNSNPSYFPAVSLIFNTQVSEASASPAPTTQNNSNSNDPSVPLRPPDIGFRDSVLPNVENSEASAPLLNDLENNLQNSDDENAASEVQYPDIPEADIPQNQAASENEEQSSQEIRVRLKYLDDSERTVTSDPKAIVRDFKSTHFSGELASNRTVRLIFCGHLLRDDSTLESYHVVDNSVLHVQVLQIQNSGIQSTQIPNPNDLDIGNLVYGLFALILGLCWTTFIRFPEFFNAVSLSILALLTAGYVIVRHRA